MAARREVGALDELHQVARRGLRVVEVVDDRVDHLSEVVRRDVRRHADRDAAGAVDQQVREARGRTTGWPLVAVEVRNEVDGLGVDVAQQLHRHRRETRFGVVADEPVRDEGVVLGLHTQDGDRPVAGELHGGDLRVVIAAINERRDHATHLLVADVRPDLVAVPFPAFDPIDVVPAQPVTIPSPGCTVGTDVSGHVRHHV